MVGSLLNSVLIVIWSSDHDKSHNEPATIRKRKVAIALKRVNRLKRGILEPFIEGGLQRSISGGSPQRTLCSAAFNSLALLRFLVYTILQPLFSKA